MSQLGGTLAAQAKYAEAEPLLVKGYEGLKARASKIPAPAKGYLVRSGERLVALYEAWDKKNKAQEWRNRLAAKQNPQ
jgi:hypothetical protein